MGIGVLFVTHDLHAASRIADRVLVMKDGVLIESGSAKEVLSTPKTDYTKELLKERYLAHV